MRIAVVGTGYIGGEHMKAIAAHPQAVLHTICSTPRSEAIAQELQAEKEKTDKLYQETMEKLEKLRLEEEQEGGAIKEQTTQDNTQEDIHDSEELEVD